MKITIEQDECTTMLESPFAEDIVSFIRASLVTAGYRPDAVDGMFYDEINHWASRMDDDENYN